MGDKAPDMPSAQPSPYDQELAFMASREYNLTDPMRQRMMGSFDDILSGRTSVYDLPQFKPIAEGIRANYGAARPVVEGQYNIARENILGGTPRGGGQTQALVDLESNRARNVSDLAYQGQQQKASVASQILQDVLNKAYGYVTGAPTTAMAGLGGAAQNVLSQRLGQLAGTKSTMDQMQQGMGMFMNPKGKGK